MFKPHLTSTDRYSDLSKTTEISLRIEGIDRRTTLAFLNDQVSDFKITHRSACFPVHRAVIFKQISLQVLEQQTKEGILDVPDYLSGQMLRGILSCIYGVEFKIRKSQIFNALDLVYYLKISKLKHSLEEYISNNFANYQIFPLLQKSKMMGMHQIQELCFDQLQFQDYQQTKYQKYELLSCNQATFKAVILKHNEKKRQDATFGLSQHIIGQLIDQYCNYNHYNEKQKHLLQKYLCQKLIKTEHNIFFNDITNQSINISEDSQFKKRGNNLKRSRTDSTLPKDIQKSSEKIARSMIVIKNVKQPKVRQKSILSLNISPKTKIFSDVAMLKENNLKMSQEIESLKDDLQIISKNFTNKIVQSHNNKFTLSDIEMKLEQCENNLMEYHRHAMLIQIKVNRVQPRYYEDISISFDNNNQHELQDQKEENPKDQRLSISLILSKWVCL